MIILKENQARTARQKTRDNTLYHVSPSKNRASILAHGLEPSLFSRGAQKKLWLVEWKEIMWALAHTAKRHGVRPEDCDVWIINKLAIKRLQKTGLRDVWQTPCKVAAHVYMSAQHTMERYEQYLQNVTKTPGAS